MNINRKEISNFAGFVGAALVIAGFVRQLFQGAWGWFNLTLLIAGAVLLLASIVLNFGAIIRFFSGRSGKLGTNTVAISVAVIVILGIVNFLGYRHHKRFDLTTEGLFSVSDQTKKILGNLNKDVKVMRFDKDSPDAQKLTDLMAEFKYYSKRISYELIDPQKSPERARQYAIQRLGDTIVVIGERIERPLQTDEQSLVNSIIKATREKLKQVCFTEGHDEKSLNETGGDGYAAVERVLKNENYQVKTILLATSNQVPAECDVLVTAGPKKGLLPQEAAAIGKYLDEGGKFFLLADPDTNPELNDVLKAWNITLGNDTVIAGPGTGASPVAPLVQDYGSHPITKDMRRKQTIYFEARSVKTGDQTAGEVFATEIAKTMPNTFAETELKQGKTPSLDEGKDTKGPLTIGVAASKKIGDKEARVAVFGDSDFASNGAVGYLANGDMFFNTINWLAQDEDLISIRPKATTNRSVTMTQSQRSFFFWLAVLFMPLAVISSGAYVWWKRR
ncbi:MAG: Gldg family protein [Acidobacteria bacterium]|nr:Gldg family protein [Acidobacteriota bacterium]